MAKKEQDIEGGDLQELVIRCRTRSEVPIEELVEFQDEEFKTLSPENALRLEREMMMVGFIEPITVWEHDSKFYVLNGHQRLRVVKSMLMEARAKIVVPDGAGGKSANGESRGSLPVNLIGCKNVAEAKHICLGLTAQYGTVTEKGYKKMLKGAKLKADEADQLFMFPELKGSKSKKEKVEFEAGKEEDLELECPKCGETGDLDHFLPEDEKDEGATE